jgi:hypothetical protein
MSGPQLAHSQDHRSEDREAALQAAMSEPGRKGKTAAEGEGQTRRRKVPALVHGWRNLELLRQQVERLEGAIAQRDFRGARAGAETVRTIAPGLAGSIERAKREGADPAAVALLARHTEALRPRVEAALRKAPAPMRGLGIDVVEQEADERMATSWTDSLELAERSPQQREAARAHEGYEAALDHRISVNVRADKLLNAPAYLHHNMAELRGELGEFLGRHLASTGHARVELVPSPGAFLSRLLSALRPDDASACVTTLRGWLLPARLFEIVDGNRAIFEGAAQPSAEAEKPGDGIDYAAGPKGPAGWTPAVAAAVGAALLGELMQTLPRLCSRLTAATYDDEHAQAAMPSHQALDPSTPLELQVARAMLGGRAPTVRVLPAGRRSGAQAERRPTMQAAITRWNSVQLKLTAIGLVLQPRGLSAALAPALIEHLARRPEVAVQQGRELGALTALLAQQDALLEEVARALGADATEAKPATGEDPRLAKVARRALQTLAKIAGQSHAPEVASALLEDSRVERRDAAFLALQAVSDQVATDLEMIRELGERGKGRTDTSALMMGKTLQARHAELRIELAELRGQATGTGKIDGERLQRLLASASRLHTETDLVKKISLVAQTFAVFDELTDDRWAQLGAGLEKLGGAATVKAAMAQGKPPTSPREEGNEAAEQEDAPDRLGEMERVRRGASKLQGQLSTLHSQWLKLQRRLMLLEGREAPLATAELEAEMGKLQARLASVGRDADIQTFLQYSQQVLEDARLRALFAQMIMMLTVAVATGGMGTVAQGVALGAGSSAMTAQLVGLTVETLSFSALSARLNDTPIAHELSGGFLGNLATFGAMRVAQGAIAASRLGKIIAEGRTAGAVYWAAKAGALTTHTLVTFGVQYAQMQIESLARQGRVLTVEEQLQLGVQGMAMLIGGAVIHHGMTRSMEHALAGGARLGSLAATQRKVNALARRVAAHGDPQEALQLLSDLRVQLEAELAHWRSMDATSEQELRAQGLSKPMVAEMGAAAKGNLERLQAMKSNAPPELLGLHALVPGQVYAGDRAAIARMIEMYGLRGYDATGPDERGVVTLAKKGEPTLQVIERVGETAPVRPGEHQEDDRPAPRRAMYSEEKVSPEELFHEGSRHNGSSKDAKSDGFRYDAATRTMSFEGEHKGIRRRFKAQLAEPILDLANKQQKNCIVGTRTFKDAASAERVLREVAAGNFAALEALGVSVPKSFHTNDGLEFGIGRLPNGERVIVKGALEEVDWAHLPGIVGEAHVHPSTTRNDLGVEFNGSSAVSLSELLQPSFDNHPSREIVFPSVVDVQYVATHNAKGHRVITPFILEEGMVKKGSLGGLVG